MVRRIGVGVVGRICIVVVLAGRLSHGVVLKLRRRSRSVSWMLHLC